jgi:hypothetical protein
VLHGHKSCRISSTFSVHKETKARLDFVAPLNQGVVSLISFEKKKRVVFAKTQIPKIALG